MIRNQGWRWEIIAAPALCDAPAPFDDDPFDNDMLRAYSRNWPLSLPFLISLCTAALLLVACDATGGGTPPSPPPASEITWSAPEHVPTQVEGGVGSPSLAATEAAVYLAFDRIATDQQFPGPDEVYVMARRDGAWTDPINVSQTETPSSNPVLAADPGGTLHVVWGERLADSTDRPGGKPNAVYYARSDDGGLSWSGPEEAFASGSDVLFAPPRSLAFDESGNVHLVLSSRESSSEPGYVRHLKRTASGWSQPAAVVIGATPDVAATEDGRLLIAYIAADASEETRDRNSVFFVSSSDGGRSWNEPVLVHRSGFDQPAYSPLIESTNGHLLAAWPKSTDGDIYPDEIFFSSSADGSEWSEAVDMAPSVAGANLSEIESGLAGSVHVTFSAEGAPYYSKWDGSAWAEAEQLLGSEDSASQVGFAAAGNRLYVAIDAGDVGSEEGIYLGIGEPR